MFKPHGYPIELEDIELESFLKYCHRPDLDIYIEADFEDEECGMLLLNITSVVNKLTQLAQDSV